MILNAAIDINLSQENLKKISSSFEEINKFLRQLSDISQIVQALR
jgi:Asp-tRNA(Asn)/Glu-tRNA(Gln) amidotransferase C subunit